MSEAWTDEEKAEYKAKGYICWADKAKEAVTRHDWHEAKRCFHNARQASLHPDIRVRFKILEDKCNKKILEQQ